MSIEVSKILRGLIGLHRSYQSARLSFDPLNFPIEGGVEIRTPRVKIRDLLNSEGRRRVQKIGDLAGRTESEPLTRFIVNQIIETGSLLEGEAVIDIGCWIGDNCLPWAKCLGTHSRVIAIDPSADNIGFVQRLRDLNEINNLDCVEGACSSKDGEVLNYEGNLDHASFRQDNLQNDGEGVLSRKSTVISKTLDRIAESLNVEKVGLIHLDVEGYELDVLRGAQRILELSSPIVVFEVHLSERELCRGLKSFFDTLGYESLMINEALLGNFPDSRNVIAFESSRSRIIPLIQMRRVDSFNYFPAVTGQLLVPFVP